MCILPASDPTSGFIRWSSCAVCNRKIIMKNKGSNHQFQMQWFQTTPMTASALIKTFLSEPNKVKMQVLFTQEMMGDGHMARQGSAPRNITSVHNVIYSRTLCQQRDQDTGKCPHNEPWRAEHAVRSHSHLCCSPVCTQNTSTAS